MKDTVEKKPKKSRKILNIIVNVVLVLVILLGIICSYSAFVSKNGSGVPDLLGARFFSIQSNSMEPVFYKGDFIVDTRVDDYASLKKDDVITFWTVVKGERILNTHRIVEVTFNDNADGGYYSFITRGDNTDGNDPLPVHQRDVVGLYRFRVPALGTVVDFLQTGWGFGLIIVLPVALFLIFNIVQFFRAFTNYRVEKMKLELAAQMALEKGEKADEPAEMPADEPAADEPAAETPAEQ